MQNLPRKVTELLVILLGAKNAHVGIRRGSELAAPPTSHVLVSAQDMPDGDFFALTFFVSALIAFISSLLCLSPPL
jgi:hypothetical protein